MSMVAKFKRDLAKHPAKAGVLGVLAVTMAVFGVKAFFELRGPAVAAAAATNGTPTAENATRDHGAGHADTEKRLSESKELWHTLREVRGIDASLAFSFDSAYYMPDPNRKVIPAQPAPETPLPAQPIIRDDTEAKLAEHARRILEQSHGLVVRSTSVSDGRAVAIINQQLLGVGDKILGFEITAIRSREVEFKKDGQTVTRSMATPRGQ